MLRLLKGEFERVQKMAFDYKDFDKLYDEVVRPREGIIQYSERSARLTENPTDTINTLFEHYVHHSSNDKADHEEQMSAGSSGR